MTMVEERLARLESERENEYEWRREMLARLDRLESNQQRLEQQQQSNLRWVLGATILLHSVTIGAIFAAAALF